MKNIATAIKTLYPIKLTEPLTAIACMEYTVITSHWNAYFRNLTH